MSVKFIDISNHQGRDGLTDLSPLLRQVDGVVCKATEGTGFVDRYCDGYVSQLKKAGKCWGFYHFAGSGSPEGEARYFHDNCKGYFGHGVPVLDWEGNQSVSWVNRFVRELHGLTGVWCWIYANPWRFNQGGVERNCMRWVASYPSVTHPTFEQASKWKVPSADGLVGAWQFCSDGRLVGYRGNLDCDLFYGDDVAWRKYAGAGKPEKPQKPAESDKWRVTESTDSKIVIERK